jgi:hypothetical protein
MTGKSLYITKNNTILKWSDYLNKYVECTDYITLADEYNRLFNENKKLKRRLMIAQDKNRGLMK